MSPITLFVNSINDLSKVAEKIHKLSSNNRIFLFDGEMGSGKTTLIKYIVALFGVKEASSPTFSIINTYLGNKSQSIYHVDCYRIENENEIENIGLLEILYGKNLCFIEWPEKIHNFLPNNYVKININIENNLRKITIET
ncbi:MAG: tRNA (adenosine(37)-N6)-threonylcarbamoyltransferase complex ATPase subunit type 1 TsaE [Crocinitomicaceae bacterium]|nr:tRNA (adenosine(37)-N6)-threonylcarbamoyltransferase complex ATPase subunit type 1 TsaE [Crocinitomicaceae bacterium]